MKIMQIIFQISYDDKERILNIVSLLKIVGDNNIQNFLVV